MARHYLGETFDIHAGGLDLVFPHHENEIAQSCCAHDTEIMATVWMHNGFVTMGDNILTYLAALDVFMTFGRDLWQFDDARQQHII